MKVLRNLIIDSIVFFGFLIAYEEKITSESIHEWLGLAIFVTLLFHLFLHWKWVVKRVTGFFKKMPFLTRINFMVDFLFFVAIIGVTLSGVLMSKAALPAIGITVSHGGLWKPVHSLFADASLYLLAVHFALHWRWIVDAFVRFVIRPVKNLSGRKAKLEPAVIKVENDWE